MTRTIALILALFAAGPSHAQSSATGQQIVQASAAALTEGNAVQAAQLADIILAVKPNDLDALILRSRAALAMGDLETAKALSKQAFRVSDNKAVKFGMARLAAIAHAEGGEDTRAQLWLRRARQFAPDEERAAQVGQEFRQLANRNPWSTSLQFGVTPSSNVNGGSQEDTLFVPGFVGFLGSDGFLDLSVDARDLPGLEILGGFQSTYRLNASRTSATFLNIGGNFRGVVLQQSVVDRENDKERQRVENEAAAASLLIDDLTAEFDALPDGEAKDDARLRLQNAIATAEDVYEDQNVNGSDFSSGSVSAGVLHRRILKEGWDPTSFRLELSHTWYAGDPLSWRYTASVNQTVSISDDVTLSFRLARSDREVFERDDADGYTVNSYDARAGLTYQLANADRVSVSFDLKDSRSTNANSDYDQRGIYADYAFGQSYAGMRFGIGFGVSERDYGIDQIAGLDRVDTIYSLNARTRFTEVEFYGFQPEISLNASRTDSVNSRYDTDTVRIGFDLRSSF